MSHSAPSPGIPGQERYRQALWIERILRQETIGGGILLGAALLAVIAANSVFSDAYFALRQTYLSVGVGDWSWKISVGHFTADGLLAIFFFLVGLELKREFVVGELRDPKKALVPVVAAFGGVLAPAAVYLAMTRDVEGAARGWAIPIATDIAFALGVLALVGTALPLALRTFLLTLAVVDDLIGITVIAVFYTEEISWLPMVGVVLGVAAYAFLAQRYRSFFALRAGAAWFILLPIGVLVWFFMYSSGVHATIAGVVLGLTVPVRTSRRDRELIGEPQEGLAEVFEHRFRPLSAGVAVPLFAFFAAGVNVGSWQDFLQALSAPVPLAIMTALVVGKTVGVVGATFLVTRLPGVTLPRGMAWRDLLGISVLAGIGFTVSLLIGELSFGQETLLGDEATIGVLVGSVAAALVATVILLSRNRYHREQIRAEKEDRDGDGVPDVYQDDETQS